jgi:catechol 2,3-dioxygenase-like lactoylglutathione lyase family enzyme
MALGFAGAILDVPVSDLARAEAFYATLLGRPCDLRPQPDQCEWRLYREPEVTLRLTGAAAPAGTGTLAVGVADLAAERARLADTWPDLPAPAVKPGIITRLTFPDPDGNLVTLWQDLMGPRR